MIQIGNLQLNPDHSPGLVILRSNEGEAWRLYQKPMRIITATTLDEVALAMAEVVAATDNGFYVVGLISYDAAPAFDSALEAQSSDDFPLVWFGVYQSYEILDHFQVECEDCNPITWTATIDDHTYYHAINTIHTLIGKGETYQTNFTYRLESDFSGSAWSLFMQLVMAQEPQYAAYINTGEDIICSASPELFFRLHGSHIECRPMKGTAPRGRWLAEDERLASRLMASEKDRAENVMIVDMVRNDLGRIARTGTVRVPSLFDLEKYFTVWQMTSTVTAETDATISEIFRALFPCASITGAPKVRTTQIIRELERDSRGVYTGSIGYIDPNRIAQFSVAIRTVQIHTATGKARYGTGGGIVWDSTPEGEYAEAITKAAILTKTRPTFRLLETMLYSSLSGYFLRDFHIERMQQSAKYFDFEFDREHVLQSMLLYGTELDERNAIIRMYLDETGKVDFDFVPHQVRTVPKRRWKVRLATKSVDSSNCFLFHKTTNRSMYDAAKAPFPEYDDVILFNERGEITESTRANIVIKLGDTAFTPPIRSGLLAGTYRTHLQVMHRIRERVITIDELKQAEKIHLINSVRGWIPINLELPEE